MKLVQMRSSVDFVAGGIASCVSEVLTLPMDTVKVSSPRYDKRLTISILIC